MSVPRESVFLPLPADERRLFARYKRTGEVAARDALVARFMPLALQMHVSRLIRRSITRLNVLATTPAADWRFPSVGA